MEEQLLLEPWIWFPIVTLMVIWRFISRSLLLGGFRNLLLEDYVMVITYGFYTNLIAWVAIQSSYPETNILPPTGMAGLTQKDIQDRIYGSKVTFVIEQSMIMVQWGCKVCMVLIFYRLTDGLRAQTFVKILIVYIIIGWLCTEIFYYGIWCRPFSDYFAVKEDNDLQCETAGHHLIMSFVFNLSSDVAMLCIPLPLFINLQLHWLKKLTVCCVFSLGVFVITAAILSRYYCFVFPDSILWIYWYVREASTAVLVTNVPNCYTLLHRLLRAVDLTISKSRITFLRRGNRGDNGDHNFSGISSKKSKRTRRTSSDSMETITRNDLPLQIWQQKAFAVEEHNEKDGSLQDSVIHQDQQGFASSTVTAGSVLDANQTV